MADQARKAAKTYRAGIIGLGFIGAGDQVSGDAIGGQQVGNLDGTHVSALSRHPRVNLVAGSSRDAGRRERFAGRTGCRTYADWQAMLGQEPLDIVSIATYAPAHAEMVLACVEKGVRAIYCEKPIATRLAEAEAMVRACEVAGVLLAINHNRRFNPNYRRLRDALAAGALGELTSASIRWGGGRLGNVGTHLIDATCMVTGREACAVSATLDLSEKADCRGPEFHDPGGFGWMRLQGGLLVSVDAANAGSGSLHIIVNGTLGRAITGTAGVTLEFWDGKHEQWPGPGRDITSMDRAVGEIVAALDGEAPFSYDAAQAVHTLEAIVAFHSSHARNGAWVDLPLQGPNRDREVQTA
jgi:predicted dehydrogenase